MFRITLLVVATLLGGAPQVQRDRAIVPDAVGTAVIAGRVTILDVNGAPFVVGALREGEYALTFTAETFVTLELRQKRPSEPARRVQLADGQSFDKADITLPPMAAIEGRLLDEFGDPAPGMTIQAAQVQFAAGKNRLMPGAQSQPTDDLRRFRIVNLPPSEYYLVALSGQFAGPDEAA